MMVSIRERAAIAAKALVVAAAFSLALSTAYLSVMMTLFFLAWLLSGDFASKYRSVRNNPGALVALGLFLFYVLGMFYSDVEWEQRLVWLEKYHKLLYIPLVISVLDDEIWRRRALDAFLAGMLFLLLLSYLKLVGLLPHPYAGEGYVVFKGRIAHGILMAFAFYLVLCRIQLNRRWSSVWVLISLLMAINVIFMVNGRTGQLVLLILFAYFAWQKWRFRAVQWGLIFSLLAIAGYLFLPELPQTRLLQVLQEVKQHDAHAVGMQTSSGLRLEFYENSARLISQNPILGAGTGGFEREYKLLAESRGLQQVYVPNPHNEYLLTAQQLGLLGMLMLLYFWWNHWRSAGQLHSNYHRQALKGLVLTLVVGSLFNSLLLDAGEGKFYCLLAGVLLSDWCSSAGDVS